MDPELLSEKERLVKEVTELYQLRKEIEDERAPKVKELWQITSLGRTRRTFINAVDFADKRAVIDFLASEIKTINMDIMQKQTRLGEIRRTERDEYFTKVRDADAATIFDKRKLFIKVAEEILPPEMLHRILNIVEGRMMASAISENQDVLKD